jgi:hypothetical protein
MKDVLGLIQLYETKLRENKLAWQEYRAHYAKYRRHMSKNALRHCNVDKHIPDPPHSYEYLETNEKNLRVRLNQYKQQSWTSKNLQ